jgi:hypothetical protein
MATIVREEERGKIAPSVWKSAVDRATTCLIVVAIPEIGYSVVAGRGPHGHVSVADLEFDDYDDERADLLIDEVAHEIELETHVPPQILKSSAMIIADLTQEQITRIAQLKAVRKIGPNVGFKV